MYTKAIDRMLDIVDALQADFTDCTEGLVTLASVVLLRYLKVAAVDRHKIDLVAQVCLTVASKLNERMYVPLGRSDGTKEERFKCKLELELLGKLGWHIHASTPYTIKEIALEVIFECADPQITDEQRKRARCAARPAPGSPPPAPHDPRSWRNSAQFCEILITRVPAKRKGGKRCTPL